MADTYRKVYLHIVFAVKYRQALLDKSWRGNLFAYIAGILNQRGHFSLAVNGYSDHIHLFFHYSCNELIADLVREIKKASNQYIKENKLSPFKFEWQNGYGVFSNGYREKDTVIKYILNQEEHHGKQSFRKEYLALLKKYEIEYKDEYVFEFFE
jgi:putative transposase